MNKKIMARRSKKTATLLGFMLDGEGNPVLAIIEDYRKQQVDVKMVTFKTQYRLLKGKEDFIINDKEVDKLLKEWKKELADMKKEDKTPEPEKTQTPEPDSTPEPNREEEAEQKYTLSKICDELKLDSKKARKILRDKKIEKPGKSWSWVKNQLK
jgi:hypothetical protein